MMYYAGRIWYNVGSGIANSYAKSIILDAFPRYKARKKKNLIGGLIFMKKCSKCGENKENFYNTSSSKDGLTGQCKSCIDKKNKENRENTEKPVKLKLIKKSLEKWCNENNRQDVLTRWDYELNELKPSEVGYASRVKRYLKCPREIHNSELRDIKAFAVSGQEGSIKCKQCNSIAQYIVNTYGDDGLDSYWDWEKNNELGINPWKLDKGSRKRIFIKCQEVGYHESYDVICKNFKNGSKCPYCHKVKIHPLDSLGTICPESLKVWSDENINTPFIYAPHSYSEVMWKCQNDLHRDFKRNVYNSFEAYFCCPECNNSRGEKKIEAYLNSNGLNFVPEKKFEGLYGLGNGFLSYDFYLHQFNLLIEYQGEFHDGSGHSYTELNIVRQREHDRRKKQYAKDNGIILLEIWYYDFNNVDEILAKYFTGISNGMQRLSLV